MFDDQPQQNQPGIPGNLPVEPEDIFGDTDPAPGGAPVAPQPPADVAMPPLADRPADASAATAPEPVPGPATALGAGVLQPKSAVPETAQVPEAMQPQPGVPAAATPMGAPGIPQAAPAPTGIDYDVKSPSAAKGIVTIVIAVVVIVIIGGGGWWIYSNFVQVADVDDGPAVVTDDVFEEEIPVPDDTDTGIPLTPTDDTAEPEEVELIEPELDEAVIDDQVLFGEPVDKDADGLDDATEVKFNTDPNNWDSDGDELSDGDEVNVWKTNPLNPDSDGDSFLDGAEIKNGYNPAGPGKLFEVPTSTEI